MNNLYSFRLRATPRSLAYLQVGKIDYFIMFSALGGGVKDQKGLFSSQNWVIPPQKAKTCKL